MNPPTSRNRFGRRSRRRGVAAAEFAVCLPVILLLVFAMIESCTMIFLKQSLSVASYEGIRAALEERAVAADVLSASEQVLADRQVQGATITIEPNDFETLAPGQFIQVTVSAPADANSIIPGRFFGGRSLSASATMMKEL